MGTGPLSVTSTSTSELVSLSLAFFAFETVGFFAAALATGAFFVTGTSFSFPLALPLPVKAFLAAVAGSVLVSTSARARFGRGMTEAKTLIFVTRQ